MTRPALRLIAVASESRMQPALPRARVIVSIGRSQIYTVELLRCAEVCQWVSKTLHALSSASSKYATSKLEAGIPRHQGSRDGSEHLEAVLWSDQTAHRDMLKGQ